MAQVVDYSSSFHQNNGNGYESRRLIQEPFSKVPVMSNLKNKIIKGTNQSNEIPNNNLGLVSSVIQPYHIFNWTENLNLIHKLIRILLDLDHPQYLIMDFKQCHINMVEDLDHFHKVNLLLHLEMEQIH